MPDATPSPTKWREVSLDAINTYLVAQRAARPLSATELKTYDRRTATHGWRVSLSDNKGEVHVLDFFVDGGFPYTLPHVALANKPERFSWPHVEEDNVLCLLPTAATISPRDPVGVTIVVLDSAVGLLNAWNETGIEKDFQDEFLSYWAIAETLQALRFLSIVKPEGPSREVLVWRGKRSHVCSDSRPLLQRWLQQWEAEKTTKDYPLEVAILLWLPAPLRPEEYPISAKDIINLASIHAPEAVKLLIESPAVGRHALDVLIGAPTPHGVCFAAVTIPCPKSSVLIQGFRPDHIPREILLSRYFSQSNEVTRSIVTRVDHNWIHGRDKDSQQGLLAGKRVLVLGCGAIGSGVARLLAQAGVGSLILVDHQEMDWPNISRHALGARSVPKFKAKALANDLQRDFPHHHGIEAIVGKFHLGQTALIDDLPSYDLIVSATGDWQADALLNDLQNYRRDLSPIIYAWLEPHAVAAHALAIPGSPVGGCLRCGFSDRGNHLVPVSSWPNEGPLQQEPACGATFSPFGPTELSWSHSLTAELAIDCLLERPSEPVHRIWIGRKKTLAAAGGEWSDIWRSKVGDPGEGSLLLRQAWQSSDACPVCVRSPAP